MASNEMFGTVYKGRYNILMMGAFATYAGFIYNELFSVPLEFFGYSAWCSPDTLGSPGCGEPPPPHPPTHPPIHTPTRKGAYIRSSLSDVARL
jgi:hypothetical protein